MRRLLWGLAALLATPARATFDQPGDVVLGTAQTLEQGELMIGVFSPVAYGINDALTLFIHPISLALLTPNAAFRWRFYDGDVVRIAAQFGAAGTLPVDGVVDDDSRRPLGHADVGFVTTALAGSWLFTARTSYQRDIDPADDDFDWTAAVAWVIAPTSLLQVQGGFQVGRVAGLHAPSAMATYVHSWGQVHLAAGIAYGEYPLSLDSGALPKCTGAWAYPCLWPVVDVFWRF